MEESNTCKNVHCMMQFVIVFKLFWVEDIVIATYNQNCLPIKTIHQMTPKGK
jgi:hypothetical protein